MEININKNGFECTKKIKIKPLPVQARIGIHTSRTNKKISIGEFNANLGILAQIVNFDINGKCAVREFELVRIPRHDLPSRHLNLSGRFDSKSRSIINETEGRDLYLFRNIMIQCPGDENARKLEDVSFEIAESIYLADSTFYPNGYKVINHIDIGNGDTIRLDHFTGKYELIAKSGVKKSEGNYSATFGCEPEKNGTWIERYSNGNIKTIGTYLAEKK
ncbi:MAG: hypothetical protein ACJATI_000535 [Halioglobus sp.]